MRFELSSVSCDWCCCTFCENQSTMMRVYSERRVSEMVLNFVSSSPVDIYVRRRSIRISEYTGRSGK